MVLPIQRIDAPQSRRRRRFPRHPYPRRGDVPAPPNIPHNPVRFADTVGIVLEQPRPAESKDRLRWYCQNCREIVNEETFHCTDLGTQIKEAVNGFKASDEKKVQEVRELADLVPRNVVQP